MASKSNRQRKLERARAERRLAKRAEQARRKRQVQAAIGGALALILIALGTTWLLGGFDGKKEEPVALPSCTWTAKDPSTKGITDTGLPPSTGEARSGAEVLTIKTDLGDITASMDLTQVPCTAASLKYLGSKGYYDGVACNHLDTTTRLLTCGDPVGDGTGSPGYQFPLENQASQTVGTAAALPSTDPSASPAASPSPIPSYYSKGTIVMANNQGANGGQFYIVYGDGSDLQAGYTIVGTVTSGLELVEGVATEGVQDGTTAGAPKKAMTIKQLYVGEPPTASPSASASESATPAPSTSS